MRVEVVLYGTLRDYLPGYQLGEVREVTLPEGATLACLYAQLGIPATEIKQAFVAGRRQEPDQVLVDGTRVAIFPPLAGGIS